MKKVKRITRRDFNAQLVTATGLAAFLPLATHPLVAKGDWKIGHHFWNWDHAWNTAAFFEERLRLTKMTGYEGWEAKPNEIGVSAEEMRAMSDAAGVTCAAIGGGLKEGIDYAHKAGVNIVRANVPQDQYAYWVDYAGERDIIIVIHPHVQSEGATGGVETREELLAYLDARPGVFACPDTGHLALCGSDPAQTIRDLGERCKYIHLKDTLPDRVGTCERVGEKFCELGTGALDLAGVIKALEDIQYEGWIMVERDSREPDFIQSARNMRATIKKFGY